MASDAPSPNAAVDERAAGRTRRSPNDTREAILGAALALFAERTFHGCAVPDIAQRAGVATGSIYRHFADKEALVNSVYQRWKGELRRRLVDEAPAPTGDVGDELHAWWRSLVEFVTEHPVAYAFLQAHHHEPYLDDESRAVALAIDAAALDTAQRAADAGQLGGVDPVLGVALVLGAFDGVTRVQQLYPGLLPPDAFARAEDLVLRLFEAPTAKEVRR